MKDKINEGRSESPKKSTKSVCLDYSKLQLKLDTSDPELCFEDNIVIGGTPQKLIQLLADPAYDGTD